MSFILWGFPEFFGLYSGFFLILVVILLGLSDWFGLFSPLDCHSSWVFWLFWDWSFCEVFLHLLFIVREFLIVLVIHLDFLAHSGHYTGFFLSKFSCFVVVGGVVLLTGLATFRFL